MSQNATITVSISPSETSLVNSDCDSRPGLAVIAGAPFRLNHDETKPLNATSPGILQRLTKLSRPKVGRQTFDILFSVCGDRIPSRRISRKERAAMADEKLKTSGVTYTQAGTEYFEKRQLTRTAGFWGLWGIGVAAVISGDFSGWNFGIGVAGWAGLGIATVLIIVMYFGMLFSIGEMSAAMPHTGGAYSFARAAMGPWVGFVSRFAETI